MLAQALTVSRPSTIRAMRCSYAVIRGWLRPDEIDRITTMVEEVEHTKTGPFHTYEKLEGISV
jgi:hypothetical protein